MTTGKRKIEISGLIKDASYCRAKSTAEIIEQQHGKEVAIFCHGMLEYQWIEHLNQLRKNVGGELWTFEDNVIVSIDDQVIGSMESFADWCKNEYDYIDVRPLPLFHALAKEEFKSYLTESKHDLVFFDISIAKKYVGRLLIQLFSNALPKTCENFKQLCIGKQEENTHHNPPLKLAYKNSILHRIVKNGWIQGGDIVAGRGDQGWSIYGDVFSDENYSVLHSRKGVLGMANKGRHSNASQFYITLQPCAWMDCQYVAFGQVIEGLDVLDKIEQVDTYNERPLSECSITDCGITDIDTLVG